MPETISGLDTAIAAIKTTTSGLVEWGQNDSLDNVTDIERNLLLERGVAQAADITALQAIAGTEAQIGIVVAQGLFLWSSTGTADGINKFAAAGGGIWTRMGVVPASAVSTYAALTDVALSAIANGQIPVWNSSTSKWNNQNLTVAWGSVTSKPTTIAGYGITDLIVAVQPTSGSNSGNITLSNSLPAATGAVSNIVLGSAALPQFVSGNYNIIAAPRALSDVYGGSNSVVLTPRTSLHAGVTGARLVTNSVVIGDVGALDDIYVSDSLTNCVAIGTNGVQRFTVDNGGLVYINYTLASVGTQAFQVHGTTLIKGATTIDAALTVNSTVTLTGVLTSSANVVLGSTNTITWGSHTYRFNSDPVADGSPTLANFFQPLYVDGTLVKLAILS